MTRPAAPPAAAPFSAPPARSAAPASALPRPFALFLRAAGLLGAGETPAAQALRGGISSDIWHVSTRAGQIVIKQPLAELAVGNWHAPLERSRYEAQWLRTVDALQPGVCPKVLACDPGQHLIAMEYLDPAQHPVWKAQLLAGQVDVRLAALVGERLGRIHARSAARPELAADFDTEPLFIALRIHPYLETIAQRHPDLAPAVRQLAHTTLGQCRALVHGDVSPKNILAGPEGPIFLDAECAWWGDPAFDLAFCLNHLALKRLLLPGQRAPLAAAFAALLHAYRQQIDWEPPSALLDRAGRLLPALMLARVDGRSPVEYLAPAQRAVVRDFARARVRAGLTDPPPCDPLALLAAWKEHLP